MPRVAKPKPSPPVETPVGAAETSPRPDGDSSLAAFWLAVVTAIAYSNSFSCPFVFDDKLAISENGNLALGFWQSLEAPQESPFAGRPVVALSIVANYRLDGLNVQGYHIFNLAVHIATGWLLYGLVRRTLNLPSIAAKIGPAGSWAAMLIAALWMLHPLQTDAVTYVTQRTEVLAGFFYLATLYCAVRAQQSAHPRRWQAASIACCFLGMASKEVTASAPLMVLLYDRAYLFSSWREAIQRRRWFYCGLFASWLLLAWLLFSDPRGVASGVHRSASLWEYPAIQAWAVARYLRLALIPVGLCLDYGEQSQFQLTIGRVLPGALLISALLVVSLWAWFRRPQWGFLGAFFFMVLAPSSSIVPLVGEVAAEKRMYLPSAAVICLLTIGGLLAVRSLSARVSAGARRRLVFAAAGGAVLVTAVFGGLTFLRNYDYRSGIAIWQDTVDKFPNRRAYDALGQQHFQVGNFEAAAAASREALRIDPEYAVAYGNLGGILIQQGKYDEAVEACRQGLRLNPDDLGAHNNLAIVLGFLGRDAEAVEQYETAMRLEPRDAKTYFNYALYLFRFSRLEESEKLLRRAAELQPLSAVVHNSLGAVLNARGEHAEALAEVRRALELDATLALAWDNLARMTAEKSQIEKNTVLLNEAASYAARAVANAPTNSRAHNTAGIIASYLGKDEAALAHFRKAIEVNALDVEARQNLGKLLARHGHVGEAIEHLTRVLQINPNDAQSRALLQALQAGR